MSEFPTTVSVISDPARIIGMVLDGKKILVQMMADIKPLLDAILTQIYGSTHEAFIQTRGNSEEAFRACLQRLREKGGDMQMASKEAEPWATLAQYGAKNKGALPDVYVIYVQEDTLETVKRILPDSFEFIKSFMDKTELEAQAVGSEPENEVWKRATHEAPTTPQ